MNRGKVRSTCDRCHQQKLRCIRATGQSTCERCARLDIECRYSPRERRRIGRSRAYRISLMLGPETWTEPKTLAPAIEPPMPDIQHGVAPFPESVENGWSFLQGEGGMIDNAEALRAVSSDASLPTIYSSRFVEPLDMLALDRGGNPAPHMVPSHQDMTSTVGDGCPFDFLDLHGVNQAYNASPGYAVGFPLISTAGRLTSLNMTLCECASKLPSIEPRRRGLTDTLPSPHTMNNNTRREASLLALDEVFCATNDFVNILKSICLPTDQSETRAHTSSTTDAGLHFLGSPISLSSSSTQPSVQLDEATMLLFLSCHCRLADIYESIFKAVRHCINSSFSASHSIAGVVLPQIQVGGFGGVSSPALRVDSTGPSLPSTTVSMYLTLTITLSSQLWRQIRDTMGKGGGHKTSRDQTGSDMTDQTWDMAVKRTNKLSRAIEVIQASL